MEIAHKAPSWRWGTLLLVGLSLSIGWGIRGNFGHEYGAAFAGCLAAITVCLLSGREDWRQRLPYFAFFGVLGWGFGGSISYMQVISYTESGHTRSQWYGYVGLFYIGFLWAALGGAGTALSAVADKNRLVNFFPPLLFIFGAWFLLDLIEDPVARMLQSYLVVICRRLPSTGCPALPPAFTGGSENRFGERAVDLPYPAVGDGDRQL